MNPQTEDLESFIPKDLDDRIDLLKKRLPQSIEKYNTLCSIMDKAIRLREARAIELKNYNNTLK